MNKKLFCMFALMLIFVPVFVFAGCGNNTPPAGGETYAVVLELHNTPDEKYIEVTSDPTNGNVAEGSSVTFAIKFKNGYRPDGLVAKLNGETTTSGNLEDISSDTRTTYSASTPISHDVEWSYSIASLDQNTTISLDFANCEVGKIRLELNPELQNGNLRYAIFDEEPTNAIISNAADLTSFIGNTPIASTNGTSISVPYQSYVLFFANTNATMLMFQNTREDSTHETMTAISASVDIINLDYVTYPVGTKTCRIMPTTILYDDWNYVTVLTSDSPDSPNKFANTFAVSTLIDGSIVTGLAKGDYAIESGMLAQKSADNTDPVTNSFTDYEGNAHTYYSLSYSGVVYANIDTESVTLNRQKTLATTSGVWLEDALVMSISGIGHFNRDDGTAPETWDKFYLSTSINLNEDGCTKVDISEYITQNGSTYYVYIPKSEIQTILAENPGFVTTFKNNPYAFAYLVYDKNETMSNVMKLTLEDFDFMHYNLNPRLFGFELNQDNTINADTAQTESIAYVDYSNLDSAGKAAPIYYLNTSSVKNLDYIRLYFNLPVAKFNGLNMTVYESYTYEIKSSTDEKFTTQTVKFSGKDGDYDDFENGTLKYINLDYTALTKSYTFRVHLNEKAFDNSSHTITSITEQPVYYHMRNLADGIDFPIDGNEWKLLSENPIDTIFDQSKVIYFLTKLETTETETQIIAEKLSLRFVDKEATETEKATYDTFSEAAVYKDMLGHTATITINGETYTVMYMIMTQTYYSTNQPFFIDITTTTTDKNSNK